MSNAAAPTASLEINIRNGYAGAYGDLAATFIAPVLSGSDKQVTWAEDIRRKAVESTLLRLVESPAAVARLAVPGQLENVKGQVQRLLDAAVSAKDWIDTRGDFRQLAAKLGLR